MLCLMPIKEGELLHPLVLRGIVSSSTPLTLLASSLPPVDGARSREISINYNRHRLQCLYQKMLPEKYLLLLDSDVVMPRNAPVLLQKYLGAHPNVGCVALPTKASWDNGHIVTACACIRSEVYTKLDFTSAPTLCQCSLIAMSCHSVYLEEVRGYEIPKSSSLPVGL